MSRTRTPRRRWISTLLLALTIPGSLITASGKGCLTRRVWSDPNTRFRPVSIIDAVAADDRELLFSIGYSNGETRPHRIPIDELDWNAIVEDQGAVTVLAPPYELFLRGATLFVRRDTRIARVRACLRPIDWSARATNRAVMLTPVTAIVDVFSVPIHISWILLTAGGHGHPWVPWCDKTWRWRERLCDP